MSTELQTINRGTYSNPTRCSCHLCEKYKWTNLPFWAHTPFEVYRVLVGGMAYILTREEFKAFLSGGAHLDRLLDYGRPNGRTRLLDQVQGGYRDWATYWTLDVIEANGVISYRSLKEMNEEEEHGMNYNFDDEADGIFPIVFKKNGRALTKNGIWITRGGK